MDTADVHKDWDELFASLAKGPNTDWTEEEYEQALQVFYELCFEHGTTIDKERLDRLLDELEDYERQNF